MIEIKKSTTLEQLFETAKTIKDSSYQVVTAEVFLLSVMIAVENDSGNNPELADAKKVLQKYNVNIEKVKDKVQCYIMSEDSSTYLDRIYMRRKMYSGKIKAENAGKSELTTDILLLEIFAEPTIFISKFINESLPVSEDTQNINSSEQINTADKAWSKMSIAELDEIGKMLKETLMPQKSNGGNV